mgnify:CR=1 FL=1
MNINLNNFLYRGQDIHTRKWVYGFLVIQEEQAFIVEYSNWIDEDYSEMVAKEVDIETVGQCTGYLDTKEQAAIIANVGLEFILGLRHILDSNEVQIVHKETIYSILGED